VPTFAKLDERVAAVLHGADTALDDLTPEAPGRR